MSATIDRDMGSVWLPFELVTPQAKEASPHEAVLQVSQVVNQKRADASPSGVRLSSPSPGLQMTGAAERESLERLFERVGQDIGRVGSILSGLSVSRFTSPDTFAVEFAAVMDGLSSVQKKNQLQEIERARQQNLQTIELNAEKLKEALETAKEAQKSGLAAKIFGWISAVASIVVGAVMVATGVGAAVGALMIAGGVTGVANQAVQEMAKAGLISPAVMEKLGPTLMVIEALCAVIAVVVTFGGAAAGAVARVAGKLASRVGAKLAETMASISGKLAGLAGDVAKSSLNGVKVATQATETVLNVGTGVSQSVASGLNARATDAAADVKASRAEMAALEMLLERIRQMLQQITEAASGVMQQILQMMHAQDASLHNVTSRPATI